MGGAAGKHNSSAVAPVPVEEDWAGPAAESPAANLKGKIITQEQEPLRWGEKYHYVSKFSSSSSNKGSSNNNSSSDENDGKDDDEENGSVCFIDPEVINTIEALSLNEDKIAKVKTMDFRPLLNAASLKSVSRIFLKLTNLQSLNINGFEVGGLFPSAIGDLKKLSHLDIGGNHFHGKLPLRMAELHKLQLLNMSGNSFEDVTVVWKMKRLKYLNMRDFCTVPIFLESTTLEKTKLAESAEDKASSLSTSLNLRALNFSNFHEAGGAIAQLETLKGIPFQKSRVTSRYSTVFSGMKDLVLTHNSLGPDDMERLAPILKVCAALEELDLSFNNIGNTGLIRLIGATTKNSNLTTLGLECNQIGDLGFRAIEKELNARRGSTLTKLNLAGNDLSNEGAKYLYTALHKRNRGPLWLDLRHNKISGMAHPHLRDLSSEKHGIKVVLSDPKQEEVAIFGDSRSHPFHRYESCRNGSTEDVSSSGEPFDVWVHDIEMFKMILVGWWLEFISEWIDFLLETPTTLQVATFRHITEFRCVSKCSSGSFVGTQFEILFKLCKDLWDCADFSDAKKNLFWSINNRKETHFRTAAKYLSAELTHRLVKSDYSPHLEDVELVRREVGMTATCTFRRDHRFFHLQMMSETAMKIPIFEAMMSNVTFVMFVVPLDDYCVTQGGDNLMNSHRRRLRELCRHIDFRHTHLLLAFTNADSLHEKLKTEPLELFENKSSSLRDGETEEERTQRCKRYISDLFIKTYARALSKTTVIGGDDNAEKKWKLFRNCCSYSASDEVPYHNIDKFISKLELVDLLHKSGL